MEPRDLAGWLSSPDNIGNHLLSTVLKCAWGKGSCALYMYRVVVHWPMALLDR